MWQVLHATLQRQGIVKTQVEQRLVVPQIILTSSNALLSSSIVIFVPIPSWRVWQVRPSSHDATLDTKETSTACCVIQWCNYLLLIRAALPVWKINQAQYHMVNSIMPVLHSNRRFSPNCNRINFIHGISPRFAEIRNFFKQLICKQQDLASLFCTSRTHRQTRSTAVFRQAKMNCQAIYA